LTFEVILQQLLNGFSLGGVYALLAVGFGVVFNILKFSNFSHGGVITICAYLGFFISNRVFSGFWLSLAVTTVLGGFIGVVVERLVFRPIRIKGRPLTYFFVNSITVMMLVQQFFSAMWGDDYYTYPELMKETAFHLGSGFVVSKTYVLMLVISAVVLTALSIFIKKTKMGIAIRAASSDIHTPALMGVNTDVIVSTTFFVAGMLAAITGYFLGMTYSVTPFIGGYVIKGIIAAIIGGMGSLTGGVIAGIALGMIESILVAEIGASVTPIVVWSMIIVLLLFRPQGIAGKIYTVKA
jgi:branched-chain amino acid transport system permease protein